MKLGILFPKQTKLYKSFDSGTGLLYPKQTKLCKCCVSSPGLVNPKQTKLGLLIKLGLLKKTPLVVMMKKRQKRSARKLMPIQTLGQVKKTFADD